MWWDRSKTSDFFSPSIFCFILWLVVCTFWLLLLLLLCAWEFVLLFFYTSEHRLLIDHAELKDERIEMSKKINLLNQITDTQFWIYFIEHLFDSFFGLFLISRIFGSGPLPEFSHTINRYICYSVIRNSFSEQFF